MKKRMPFGGSKFSFPFLSVYLVSAAIMEFFVLYAIWRLITETQYSLNWHIALIVLLLNFLGFLLSSFFTVFFLLHRGLGALGRIEADLDKVARGQRSIRLTLRRGDIIQSLVSRINAILDILEKKSSA
ncbi:MAG: hypothetical protein AB1530_02645 [Candidatus Omnitrophota bacterium]